LPVASGSTPSKPSLARSSFDKDVDRPDRIVLAQIVIQPLGKQRALTAVIANDKARHRILRPNRRRIISSRAVFTQAGTKSDIVASFPNDGLSRYNRRNWEPPRRHEAARFHPT